MARRKKKVEEEEVEETTEAEATDEKKEKPKKKKVEKRPGYHIGTESGKNIADTWNEILEAQDEEKLTDKEIAEAMREEFPERKAYDESYVKYVRGLYNSGRTRPQEGKVPDKKIPEYNAEGEALPFWGEKTKAKKDAAKKKKSEKAEKKELGGDDDAKEETKEARKPRRRVRRSAS